MSGALTPARRLLAMLAEEPSLETRTRDGIDADLTALGIDPAGPVRLARRLASLSAGPAAVLLGAMIEEESAEAEIAALESADIADVRSRLPAGTVAAVTAEAQRRAGKQSNIVGLSRPRRRAVWAWTGSLVGMAACALIVVAVWWPPSALYPTPAALKDTAAVVLAPEASGARTASPETAAQLADSPALSNAAPPTATGLVSPATDSEPAAMAEALEQGGARSVFGSPPADQVPIGTANSVEIDDAREAVVATAPEPATPEPATPEPAISSLAATRPEPAGTMMGRLAEPEPEPEPDAPVADTAVAVPPPEPAPRNSLALQEAIAPPLPPALPAGRTATGDAGLGEDRDSADISPQFRTQGPALGSVDTSRGVAANVVPQPVESSVWTRAVSVTDVLIVDPASAGLEAVLMPGPSAMLFEGGRADVGSPARVLSDRLAEARRSAEGRPVIALLTLRSEDTEFDAVLVRRDDGVPAMAADPADPLLSRWFGDRAGGFSLIALPLEP